MHLCIRRTTNVDHEALLHDIIRLPHEVRVDNDHESKIHDIKYKKDT